MPSPVAPLDSLTGLSAARFGVYVHFPYCLSKCPYCDFASTAAKEVPQERYARAVLAELDQRLEGLAAREVHSVYFGGGTPSLWETRQVARVLEGLAQRLPIAQRAEVTLEANPDAADVARFAGFRAAGINRLSIGVQSFQPSTLAALGRAHDGPTAMRAFHSARAAGFDNVSLDFIYGVHGQSREQAVTDARTAVALAPEHLSAYALTLEKEALAEEVPLAKQLARGEVRLPPEEETAAMGHAVREVYEAAGLKRYEISNYARAGFHSRHNALYWTGGEYLALGVGATGTVGRVRYSNLRSAEQYLAAVEARQLPEASREQLGRAELFAERVAMGLRLSEGVDLEAACRVFDVPYGERGREVERLLAHGMARKVDGRLVLTEAGADLHSSISAALI
ncbi:MAG: radical SAM family heme chaperone HemW [Myxococcota bacterium]